jgi:hypothetical protein
LNSWVLKFKVILYLGSTLQCNNWGGRDERERKTGGEEERGRRGRGRRGRGSRRERGRGRRRG